jgi:hypothetical protein
MEGKNDPSAISVFHFYVAAFSVYLPETQAQERRMDLPACEDRQFHEISTTSAFSSSGSWSGLGSK